MIEKHRHIRSLAYVVIFCVCTVTISFLTSSTITHAQVSVEQAIQGNLDMDPEYPGPDERVSVKVEGFGVNNALALITWRINGQVVQESYGGTKYKFTSGKVGTYYQITVSLQDTRGRVITVKDSFIVADVAIAWEGRTYTPPFYKGRALQTSASEVVFQALPQVTDRNGKMYNSSELLYEWIPMDMYRTKYGGRGEDAIRLRSGNAYQAFKLLVVVIDPLGETRAKETVTVPLVEPRLRLYEEHPLMGIQYSKALLGSYSMTSDEGVLVAEPYYISATSRVDPILSYEWTVGDQHIDTLGRLVLRPQGTGSGNARIQLIVANSIVRQQNTRTELSVSFGATTGLSGQGTVAL